MLPIGCDLGFASLVSALVRNTPFLLNQALAKNNKIPMIEVEKKADLGEWLGHCKYDKEGNARKVKGTSSIAIQNYGEETEDLMFVLNHIKQSQAP